MVNITLSLFVTVNVNKFGDIMANLLQWYSSNIYRTNHRAFSWASSIGQSANRRPSVMGKFDMSVKEMSDISKNVLNNDKLLKFTPIDMFN